MWALDLSVDLFPPPILCTLGNRGGGLPRLARLWGATPTRPQWQRPYRHAGG